MDLAKQKCLPCTGSVPPLTQGEREHLLTFLQKGWSFNEQGHLEKQFLFQNFQQPMAFAQRITLIAEEENHHPELTIGWGKCKVEIWTHKINGLTQSDFYLAAKIEHLLF